MMKRKWCILIRETNLMPKHSAFAITSARDVAAILPDYKWPFNGRSKITSELIETFNIGVDDS